MRIAFVSQTIDWIIPPYQNSIGIWTYEIAERLAKRHEVVVYAKRYKQQNSANGDVYATYRFIPTIPNRIWQWLYEKLGAFSSPLKPMFASPLSYLEYVLQVAWDLRRRSIEIIHIQNSPQFIPIIRYWNPKAKIVLHMHSEWLTQLDQDVVAKRLKGVDLIIGCSNYISNKTSHRFPGYADRCRTVFNGVDTALFAPWTNAYKSNGRKRLLFVGRISPEKGIHVLLDAFRLVQEQLPETELMLLGPIAVAPLDLLVALSDEPNVQELAAFYKSDYFQYLQNQLPPEFAKNVIFHEGIPYSQVSEYYNSADVLINPSLSESFGMSLVEAMACEKPVLAARVGGMQDIVKDGITGLFVEPGNSELLAKAILKILADKAQAREMGINGRKYVLANFSWDRIASDVIEQYERLLLS